MGFTYHYKLLQNAKMNNKLNIFIRALFLILTLLFFACPDPPIDDEIPRITTITLSEITTSCTGTRLKIAVEDTTGEWAFDLTRNDSLIMTKTVYGRDTVIHEYGLTPNTTYRYQAHWRDGMQRKDSSETALITTQETTSHAFIMEIDTLGIYGSYLKDVATVNENDIWVVGRIIMPDPDSSFNGTGLERFNAAHWDGNEWELMGIYSNTLELHSIQYYSEDDIWVTDSCSPIHWDGQEWTQYHLQNMGLDVCVGKAIWGSSSSNMCFVGLDGGIVQYNGSSFVQMESGTDVDLIDIAGTPDGEHIFAVGRTNESGIYRTVLLEFRDGEWSIIYETDLYYPVEDNYGAVTSVHVLEDTAYIATAAGLWKYNYFDQTSVLIPIDVYQFIYIHIKEIYGVTINDMFFFDSGMRYIHYNGSTWYRNSEMGYMYDQIALRGADFKDDFAVMVGFFNSYQHALAVRIFR